MAITRSDFDRATKRMETAMQSAPRAVSARYDRRQAKIVIELSSGLQLVFPPDLAEGLNGRSAADLSEIEITPTGLGLHFPRIDADLYVPALLEGTFGSRSWMASQMGRKGGVSKTPAKRASSRENGKLGGRPRKLSAA
jgi:hypothetical protein